MIPAGFIQDLLTRIDIVALIGEHVTLKKAGANHMGLCPFHGEKSPSFSVSASKQFYHCFGCGASGDAIKFLTEHTGASFREAMGDLAGRVGMDVPDDDDPQARAEAARRKEKASTLGDVLSRAATSYRDQLRANPRAIDYLKSRGLTGEIASRFSLGYAPDGWRHLATVFPRYDDAQLVESGMVILQDEQGGDPAEAKRYDRFRDRIMFPIRDVAGDCIAFGGRVLGAGEPKYLNSPETPLFVKGRELYGLFEGRKAMRERGYALVVEGYMDVVALSQRGLGNAVATLGTACTDDHVRKLIRFTDAVVFSFDGDAAGRRAATRALESSLMHASDTRSFKFLFLPAQHDPDSYVRAHGVDAFESLVAGSVPLSRQLIEVASEGCDLGVAEGRSRMLARARPLWQALPEGALRSQLLRELATLSQLDLTDVTRLWKTAHGGAGMPAASARQVRPDLMRRDAVRQAAIRKPADSVARMLLQRSGWWETLSNAERDTIAGCEGWHGELFRWLDRSVQDQGPQPWAVLRVALFDEPWGSRAVELVEARDAVDAGIDPLEADLHSAIGQLRRGVLFNMPVALPGALPHG